MVKKEREKNDMDSDQECRWGKIRRVPKNQRDNWLTIKEILQKMSMTYVTKISREKNMKFVSFNGLARIRKMKANILVRRYELFERAGDNDPIFCRF